MLASDESPGGRAEARMEWDKLLQSIRDLKDIEQDVLIMRFVEDMTHREIAKVVSKTEGAVKVIQHRALKKLRETVNHD